MILYQHLRRHPNDKSALKAYALAPPRPKFDAGHYARQDEALKAKRDARAWRKRRREDAAKQAKQEIAS